MLLVVNDQSPSSQAVADYYAQKRGVPAENIVHVAVAAGDEIARGDYRTLIEGPIGRAITAGRLHDRILYIVLTKGLPVRIGGTSGPQGSIASVDSELTLLYRRMTGTLIPDSGRVENPYFLGDRPLTEAKPFSRRDHEIFLVSRLDGFSVADVTRLIDRGLSPTTDGKIVLDQRATQAERGGDPWLASAAEALRDRGLGDRVVLEATREALTGVNDVLGYYSWASNDPAIRTRTLKLGFVPGSIAATYLSSDARTFTEPPPGWTIGSATNPGDFYAGSPQSLTGDLLREGATGAAGQVSEPLFDGAVRPYVLFPAYVEGFNLIESFYLAVPYLSWQTIVVGDPLCTPFPRRAGDVVLEESFDAETELPSIFSRRRLEVMVRGGGSREVWKLVMRAESRLAREDSAGARAALEEATALDGRLLLAETALAGLYEQSGDYDRAIERYRKILQFSPENVPALNNLAYALAVHKKSPAEALGPAERAYAFSKGSPAVADTLGWTLFLTGDFGRAAELLAAAAKGAPFNAEIHLHYAFVLEATGRPQEAALELTRAVGLDKTLETRADVEELRKKLDSRSP